MPTSILHRWDVIAAAQLCAAASSLAKENDELRERAFWSEQWALDAENHVAAYQAMAHDETPRIPIGLMKDGQIIRVVPAEVVA